MIDKEEVLYGQIAVMSGFIDETQFRHAVEAKQKMYQEQNGSAPSLDKILRTQGLIDADQHDFIKEKIAVRTPKTLAGYEILKKLGQGAMGAVYKARQVSMNRIVALKVLSRDLKKNKNFVQRFEREAQIVGKLNHPNIVAGIDRGIDQGIYYYVMEFVEGRPLDSILEELGQLPERRALDIALQMARALEHAHSHGMVHRDIKPENILVTEDDVAKLCDMGLAKPENDDSNLTQIGTSLGTPHYISPEQALGRADIDIRSDIYSLGASLWMMLTGDVPFRAQTPALVLAAHIDRPLPDPRSANAQLSLPTVNLLKKMLAKEPVDRHANPTELIRDIEAILNGTASAKPARPESGNRIPASGAVRRNKQRPSQVSRAAAPPPSRTTRAAGSRTSPRKQGGPSQLYLALSAVVLIIAVVIFINSRRQPTSELAQTSSTASNTLSSAASIDPESERRLERLKEQLAAIALLTASPQTYPAALERYIALRDNYRGDATAIDRIDEAEHQLRQRAEQEAIAAAAPLELRVSELLAAGQRGTALDSLNSFPSYFVFTAKGQQLAIQRDELDGQLKQAFDRLSSEITRLSESEQFNEAIAAIDRDLDSFDRQRREQLEQLRSQLRRRIEQSQSQIQRKLLDDHRTLWPQLRAMLVVRRYLEARTAFAPLARDLEAVGRNEATAPVVEAEWDIQLLGELGDSFAQANSDNRITEPSQLPAAEYLQLAETRRSELPRWHLQRALLFFYEQAFDEAASALADARDAGADGSMLARRLERARQAALEQQATSAYEELASWYSQREWAKLRDGIVSFLDRFGKTAVATQHAEQLSAWRTEAEAALKEKPAPETPVKPDPAPEKKDLPELLHATKVRWDAKKRTLYLLYDFKQDDELKDWQLPAGLQAIVGGDGVKLENGWLTGEARGGFRHAVIFDSKVRVALLYRTTGPRLSGIGLMSSGVSKRYVLGFDLDTQGGRWGGMTTYKMFIARYSGNPMRPDVLEHGGQQIENDRTYKVLAACEGGQLELAVDGRRVLATENRSLTKGRVELNSWNPTSFDKVEISGTVDAAWLEKFIETQGADRGKDDDNIPGNGPPDGQ